MISVFDTSISTLNVGDSIIMDAVIREMHRIFSKEQHVRVPSHEVIGLTSLSIIRRSSYTLVGGSNILSSHMRKYKQWKLSPIDAYFLSGKITLMGVGWRDYQGGADLYTRVLLRRILSKSVLHSVRDNYTLTKLKSIGIDNVINTGCPTMWSLTPLHCESIPHQKSNSVVFTLTDYNRDPELDRALITMLKRRYDSIKFWVQGSKDYEYLRTFADLVDNIEIIPPNLFSYDATLRNNDIDYVGTRLHAGIRALQFGRRSLIVGIDNRAKEKKRDFQLPVIDRGDLGQLERFIVDGFQTKIVMPMDSIQKWKEQFHL